jgi:fructosamine-3-kinase
MEIINTILQQENLKLLSHKPLHGGDINNVFLVKSNHGKFVIKLNDASRFPKMFEAEAQGLQLLKTSNTFRIPEVIAFGETENQSYLLLEYIAPGNKNPNFNQTFGHQLAELHQNTATSFGLDHDNYIGSLPQYNLCEIQNAAHFYIEKRLEPQFELATKKGFSFKKLSSFYKNCIDEIPNEPPALIHGDLWNGNYLVDENGNPCLIDPAVSSSSREMDLAMMQLFGGFPNQIFESYHETFPLNPGWQNRLNLWQLYYLLVHLNLFGSGYYNSVTSILTKYS